MRFEHLGLSPDTVDYMDAWERQRQVHSEVVAGEREDTVLLLEHTAVYTAGKRTVSHERPLDGTPVIDVDRGGKITWHGPGQLVGYPIVHLPHPVDVVAHVRRLEQMMIAVCADLGVTAGRVEGRSGVWIAADERGPERKVGAIGLSIHDGVSMHGFALNCSNSLAPYEGIIACGITDAATTTLSVETGRTITPADVVPVLTRHLDELGPAYIAVTPTEGIPA